MREAMGLIPKRLSLKDQVLNLYTYKKYPLIKWIFLLYKIILFLIHLLFPGQSPVFEDSLYLG
jgi:hypothetical protein